MRAARRATTCFATRSTWRSSTSTSCRCSTAACRLFGWNRRAVTSFNDADHIDIREVLATNGIDLGAGGSIQVLTNLRVLGYVFNPVSFWWCRRG